MIEEMNFRGSTIRFMGMEGVYLNTFWVVFEDFY